MRFAHRIPRLSRPFFRAGLINAAGSAVLLGAVLPFVAVMARRQGASPELLSLLSMAPFFGLLAAGPLSRLAYRYHWGRLQAGYHILGRAFLLGFAVVGGPVGIVVLMIGFHVMRGGTALMFSSLLHAHVRHPARASLLKWLKIGPFLCALPVAWAAGRVLDDSPDAFRIVFPLAGLIAAATAVPYLRLPRRVRETGMIKKAPGILQELAVVRRDKRFLAFLSVYFIGTLAEKIGMPIRPILFADVLNMRYADVALALGIAGPALAVAGYVLWGRLLRRVNPLHVVAATMLLKGIRPVLWALAAGMENGVPLVVAGQAWFQFMIAGMDMASTLTVLHMCGARNAPLYAGAHYWFMGLRGIIGPFIGLALYRANIGVVAIWWLIAGLVFAGGLGLIAFAVATRTQPASDSTQSIDGQ